MTPESIWKKAQKLGAKRRRDKIREYAENRYDGEALVITANEIEEDLDFGVSRDTIIKSMNKVATEYDDMRARKKAGATILIYDPNPPYQPSLALRSLFNHINGKTYDGKLGSFYLLSVCGLLGTPFYSFTFLLTFVLEQIPTLKTPSFALILLFIISVILWFLTAPRTDPDALNKEVES